jgi:hypothetical protein
LERQYRTVGMGDTDEVDDAAEERQHERAATVEDVLSEVREDLGRRSYPTNSEDLASTYADTPIDLPNETESIGSAFDRIDDRFEDPEAAYEALVREYEERDLVDAETGAQTPEERAAWTDEGGKTEDIEGERQRSIERAKRTQQEEYEDAEDDPDGHEGDDGG